MNNDISKIYKEVLVILKLLPKDEFLKIPQKEIDFYEKNSDKNYDFKIDENIPLAEQKISKITNAILISIYMDYFLNEEQRKVAKDILRINRLIEEKYKK